MKCNICLSDIHVPRYPLDLSSAKLFKDIIGEIFHMQIFPQNDTEMSVCVRCEEKLHEINDFYRMVLRCHSLFDVDQNIVENDFLQELRDDEIQNALDLLGSELSEFETFSPMDQVLCEKPLGKRMKIIEEKFICDICQNSLKSKDALKQHMMMKHLSDPISCEKCHKVLNPSSLYLHEKLQHSSFEAVSCNICNTLLKHDRALKEHLRKIHNIKKPSNKAFYRICESCGKIYTNKNSFYDHLRTKHPKTNPRSVSCEICGQIYRQKKLLQKHLKTHKSQKETCQKCFRTFFDMEKLQKHLNDHHFNEFRCKFCAKIYANKFSLKIHQARHSQSSEKAECMLCHRILSSEHALKGHLRRIHKIYASKNDLEQVNELDKNVPILHQYEEVFL